MSSGTGDVDSVFARVLTNGGPFWSRGDGNVHAPAGFSTLLVLNVLGELGLDAAHQDLVAEAVEFLFGYQAADGAFRYSPTSGKLPCITGQALAGLGRLGYGLDPRAEAGYRWLLSKQWGDGGWRCPTQRLGRSPQTDAANPGATLFVLDAFRFRDNSPDDDAILGRGVDSLLRHWEIREPMGPCAFGLGSRFRQVEYPFWRYNHFYYVFALAHYRSARSDPRFGEAVATLREHVDDQNRIIIDAPPHDWRSYDLARKGPSQGPATQRWREIEQLLKG